MKTKQIFLNSILMLFLMTFISCNEDFLEDFTPPVIAPVDEIKYTMPGEEAEHEGTWLQWPHRYTYGQGTAKRYEPIWIEMTKALHTGEKVYIIAYNQEEKLRIEQILEEEGLDMSQIDFLIAKTEDVWVRDNGPIFVRDQNNNLKITNWEFNGWGEKHDYYYDNQIPRQVSNAIGVAKVNVDMVLEGGSIEIDGAGTLMATRSSILNDNRNPGLSQAEAESFLKHYLGVTNFIWLEGIIGEDVTDYHIDGIARFAQGNILLTHSQENMFSPNEYEVLSTARNANGELYERVELPIAEASEGIYMNYYVGNEVVLVPNYGESTDVEANAIIQSLYPERDVVGIIVNDLWKDGGAIHCVTQQQPR